ncbi:uncharacterized protein LOC123540297 [Mercenaria mercenaria]|uniref:uncharacterized protein LOC123540297 n=1 Tax=Mercenaria mercenaria TaxID=6596 RepID=UPI001E1E1926|nr:uncharacterized protein LOC123540297 [Mercenaria mercenaria]
MGQRESKKPPEPLPEDLLDLYVRSEFKAMDSDNDGKLTRQEVRNMLRFMGFKKSKHKLKYLGVPGRKSMVALEDYVSAFKADKVLIDKTDNFRQLFKLFDKNSDGWADRREISDGLEEVCNTVEMFIDQALQETVDTMVTSAESKISYENFLALEFQIAHRLREEDKKKSMFDED